MSLTLRYYQEEAIHAIYNYFAVKFGNPIVAMPTGTGKSVVIAEFVRSVVTHFPGQRILMLTHVKELIQQNYTKLIQVFPLAPAGVYSAGLGKKEIRPITFAGIASVVKKAVEFGHIDLVLIDECHLVSPHDETSYQNFIADLQKINPAVKVIGFSATPYRLGQGLLTMPIETKKGERPALFTDICYDITGMSAFNKLIAEGFLCTLVPKRTKNELDVSQVGTVAGEYNLNDLQAAVDKLEITRRAIDEMLTCSMAEDRPRVRWLIFATGIEHSDHIATELNNRGISARSVHSKSSHKERDEAVAWFKARNDEVRVLVNNGVFTTGFDCPEIDLIGVLRPTQSPGLWVQMLGRGTRPAEGKENCLVLDFAGNTKRLGPINDPILPRRKGQKGGGEAPVKVCEACGTYNHASVRFCVCCGERFPERVKIVAQAATSEIVRSDSPIIEVFAVDKVTYKPYFPRDPMKPVSLIVNYSCGPLQKFSEWVCLEHDGYAGKKARDWWRERALEEPPSTVEEAVQWMDKNELLTPTHIRVFMNARHPEIRAYDFTGTAFNTFKTSGKPEKVGDVQPF